MESETPEKKSPEDILIVQNIDVGCDVVDTESGYNHADYFQVKWSGYPHRIKPGETKKMPRYVAEHYAKHLCDHILQKREKETGNKLTSSKIEREKVLKEILIGVDEYFLVQEDGRTSGEKLGEKVEQMNKKDEITVKADKPATPPVETPTKSKTLFDIRKECKTLGIEYKLTDTKDDLLGKIKSF